MHHLHELIQAMFWNSSAARRTGVFLNASKKPAEAELYMVLQEEAEEEEEFCFIFIFNTKSKRAIAAFKLLQNDLIFKFNHMYLTIML